MVASTSGQAAPMYTLFRSSRASPGVWAPPCPHFLAHVVIPVLASRLAGSSLSPLPCWCGHLCGRVLSMNLGSDGRSAACGKSQDGDPACENFE